MEFRIRVHARRRGKQRYGLKITRKQEAEITSAIRSGDPRRCTYLGPGGIDSRKRYSVSLGNSRVIVVYDHDQNQVVTFLSGRHALPKERARETSDRRTVD